MRLILIRHGETDWNVQHRVQGRTDTELNARGVAQASAAAEYLKANKLNRVYCGPLKRAKGTAELIARANGADDICVMDGLTEINFGAWEGLTSQELTERSPRHWNDWSWVMHPELCREIGAESAQEILERVRLCLERIESETPKDGCALIVSHTMPIKLIVADGIGLPVEGIRRLRVDNCGASTLVYDAKGLASLHCWNNTSYLGGLL